MISAVAEVMRINVDEATEVNLTTFLNWYSYKKDLNIIEQERIKKWKNK